MEYKNMMMHSRVFDNVIMGQSECDDCYDRAFIGFIGIYERIKTILKVMKSGLEFGNIKKGSVPKVRIYF